MFKESTQQWRERILERITAGHQPIHPHWRSGQGWAVWHVRLGQEKITEVELNIVRSAVASNVGSAVGFIVGFAEKIASEVICFFVCYFTIYMIRKSVKISEHFVQDQKKTINFPKN